MAVRVRQLNGDTTFLLTFTPPFCPDKTTSRFPGDFTILIDPWLKGPSSVFHKSFQLSHHVHEPAIEGLQDVQDQLNLIIISQDKPDHCHKETLCSLPASSKIDILATSAAAKKIKSWQHFDPQRIQIMRAYDPSAPDSVVRIPIPGYGSPTSGPGKITIAHMPAKFDMTGLHNAIGITYQPPSSIFTLNTQEGRYSGATVQLSANGISRPSTAAQRPETSDGANKTPSVYTSKNRRDKPAFDSWDSSLARVDSAISISKRNIEKAISVVYTPHGVPSQVLKPYITNHLGPKGALPVMALFHSMTTESNPWFMGGTVSNGAPGGVQLAKAIGAKHWIGAHDEEKENLGLATKWCKTQAYELDRVNNMLFDAHMDDTIVLRLGVGERVKLPIEREVKLDMNGSKFHSMPNLPNHRTKDRAATANSD